MGRDVRLVAAPTASDVAEAAAQTRAYLRATPILPSPPLRALLKLETVQPTGSFKVRGAFAALARLAPGERVVAASAGNHALGIAYAATALDIQATVVCPETASRAKLAALARFPVEVVTHGETYDEAEAHAHALAGEGRRYVSAYNDPDVIAGQGTLGLELAEQLEGPFTVVCPVGGGGLAAGVALAGRQRAGIRVIGVQSEASPAMRSALKAGRIVRVAVGETLADGLAGNLEPGSVTFDILRRNVDDVVLVSEAQIAEAIRFLAAAHGLVAEGAGAAAVAAVLAARVTPERERLVVVVSGRNIALPRLAKILATP